MIMKNFFKISFLILIVCLSGCGKSVRSDETGSAAIRGVWISIYDMPLPVDSEESFSAEIEKMFSSLQQQSFDNVFVQVRPFCDALYVSKIFPFSRCLTGVQGADPGFDPMKKMISCAHEHKLKFHAWINPYRILSENDISKLCSGNPALKMTDDGESSVFFCDSGIFFNPASVSAQKLILDGVREIVENYDVDGIHIDDYFYPTTDSSIDKNQFEKYSGNLSLNEWRMANINSFVSSMYSVVKSSGKNIVVSISPSGDIDSNYDLHFADVKKWLSCEGYADLIIPQIYFGFENQENPFKKTLEEWKALPRSKNVALAVGLALYKGGKEDEFAGTGKDEWLESSDIIKRQIEMLNDTGFALYSYSYLTNNEGKNLLSANGFFPDE